MEPISVAEGWDISDPGHTFANFKQLEGAVEAFNAFKNLADGAGPPFLLCYGGVGNGKTHLLEATTMSLRERGVIARLWVVADLLAFLKKLMRADSYDDIDMVIGRYQTGGALLLDDYGVEYGTPWEASVMERIIRGRYRGRVITAMTTNKDLDEIPPRIVSPFFEEGIGKVVLNDAPDHRRQR